MTEPKHPGWLISVKTILSSIAAVFLIVSSLVGASAWCVGLYSGLATRVTTLEINTQRMSDDVKEVKTMVSQLVTNATNNRPEMRKWSK